LDNLLRTVRKQEGDSFDKAVTLLMGLVRVHISASGNPRTTYLATKSFLDMKGIRTLVAHDPRVLQGIREEFYARNVIRSWLEGHEIREFKRA